MTENENDKPQPVRKTVVMLKRAEPAYGGKLIHHWCGLDAPVDNNWVDRVSGMKFIPRNAKSIPQHIDNLYKLPYIGNLNHGGFISEDNIATVGRTIELVTLDLAKASKTYWSASHGSLLENGGVNSSWKNVYTPFLYFRTSWKEDKVFTGAYMIGSTSIPKADLYGINTFTLVLGTPEDPVSKTYYNGVLLQESNATDLGNRKFGLGTMPYGSNSHYYTAANLQVHAVRVYDGRLSDKQVLQNYEIDKIKYAKKEG